LKPIIKYRGGKSREIDIICDHIPKKFETYIEPFFGGGALYFHLEKENCIINDINKKIIHFYRDVATNYKEMRCQLDKLECIYKKNQIDYEKRKKDNLDKKIPHKNEELYYFLRDIFNKKIKSDFLDSVVFFFINKTAYSGMIRYNKKGEYNVPFGRYKNFNTKLLTKNHSDLLKKTKIFNLDYSKIFEMAQKNDFMFLDPPYDTTFSDYGNKNDFTEENHIKLSEDFKNLNCKALMLISRTPLINSLYKKYIFEDLTFNKTYSVNIRNRFKRDARHIVIKNYDLKKHFYIKKPEEQQVNLFSGL